MMRRVQRCAAGALILAMLSACQSGREMAFTGGRDIPAGQSIVFETIEGPPADIRIELASELASAAAVRKVDLAGERGTARYRIRGYLTTETGEDGSAALAFVWDLFDRDKQRARRVAGSSPVRTAARDWHDLDREALRLLAQRSMDEIAVFLAARDEAASPG